MSNHYGLSGAQMEPLKPFFPKSHDKPRVDDRRSLSGIIFINRNALRCLNAPHEFGPTKVRWKRWSDNGVITRTIVGLIAEHETIIFGRLKDWRRVATRYDRRQETFFSAIIQAATALLRL